MSDYDELKKRLDKLRGFNTSMNKNLNDESLQARLDKLRGLNVSDGVKQNRENYLMSNQEFRTNSQQSEDLFVQLCDEVNLENQMKQKNDLEDQELYAKLSNLKMNNDSSIFETTNNSSMHHNEHGSLFGFDDNFVNKTYNRLNKENGKIMNNKDFAKELRLIKNKMKGFNYSYKNISKTDPSKNKLSTQLINNQVLSDKEINLADINFSNNNIQTDSSSEDEEKYVDIVQKFVNETRLEMQADDQTNYKNNSDKELNDEGSDFCYICNEDAVLECKDCDERYCINCYREFKQNSEYRGHRYTRMHAKKC